MWTRERALEPGRRLSTARPQPEPSCPQLLHRAVHCSATQRACSLVRVKAVTSKRELPCGKGGENIGRSCGEVAAGCEPGVQNFPPSTETVVRPPVAPTGSVDRIRALSWENGLVHGFHKPYYYDHGYIARNLFRSGGCAQRAPDPSYPLRNDLTHTHADCRQRASDWSPATSRPEQAAGEQPATAGGG